MDDEWDPPSPPPKIRAMRVVPKEEDLFVDSKSVFLRENKVIGAYSSSEEYLDVQFRLLSEDFLIPLRGGVQSAKEEGGNCKPYIYQDVKVQSNLSVGETENLLVPIVVNELERVNWKDSKLFLNGSLLLLTTDNFQTVKFATIVKRGKNPQKVKIPPLSLLLKVKFIKDSNGSTLDSDNNRLKMMESPAYFEAYKYSLEYLKSVHLDIFPLKKYIVDATTTAEPPEYLLSVTDKLDFSVLMNKPGTSKGLKANPLDLKNWPTANQLNMDESQYEAFQKALTQEMTIIQGPPGTGKTFIGIQIVKLLLSNPGLLNSPILIVSYTNHALDQTLELIYNFIVEELCEGERKKAQHMILRVGGGSRSKIVDSLTLHHKIEKFTKKRILWTEIKSLQTILNVVEDLNFQDLLLRQGILDFQKLPLEIIKSLAIEEKSRGIFSRWEVDVEQIKKDPLKWFGIVGIQEVSIKDKNNSNDLSELFIYAFPKRFLDSWSPGKGLCSIRDKVLSNSEIIFDGDVKWEERWAHYFSLVKCVVEIVEGIKQRMRGFQWEYSLVEHFLSENESITSAKVIGMTTTGAVKHKEKVLQTKPKITIVEEAAHVLEIFVVASLTQHCQQLVLIGDHKQLRPLTGDYNLAIDYKFDISLMERLVKNGIDQGNHNWTQLKVQHRMRPEIARMVCPAIYEELHNHSDVHKYPDVKGISKNLFFIDHRNPEGQGNGSFSYFNQYEADSLAELVNHFVSSGYYQPNQITVIATYLAQKLLLDSMLKYDRKCKGVRVSTVDCYQGEENDIILLSLVRNNDRRDVGFLSTDNRVCVALSRARHGLFIMGNMRSLMAKSETWAQINAALEEMDSIGSEWPLKKTEIDVMDELAEEAKELDLSTDENQIEDEELKLEEEIGLTEVVPCSSKGKLCKEPEVPTSQRLKCGHYKEFKDKQKQWKKGGKINCMTIVDKILKCGHEKKVPCCVEVEKVMCNKSNDMLLDCGHMQPVPCHKKSVEVKCIMKTIKKLNCGHEKEALCYESESSIKCEVPVALILSCKHRKILPCHENHNIGCDVCVVKTLGCGHQVELPLTEDTSEIKCKVMIKPDFPCGHESMKNYPCYFLNQAKCSFKVPKRLPCGHYQGIPCHQDPTKVFCASNCTSKIMIECHQVAVNNSDSFGRGGEKYCQSY